MNKILVVESDNNLKRNIMEFLSQEGYNVDSAENGAEAIKSLTNKVPSAILSGVALPYVTGLDLLNYTQSHSNFNSIPFIFMTNQNNEEHLRDLMSKGADDFLIKPFKLDDLLSTIKIRLNKHRQNLHRLENLKISLSKQIPHELKTPLVAILGFSDLLRKDAENIHIDDVKDMSRSIYRAGQRLHNRIEKFLVFSEIEMLATAMSTLEKIKNEIMFVEPYLVKQEIKSLVDYYSRKNDINVLIQPSKIKISERHFLILIKELIDNALKFSKAGSNIEIEGKQEENTYSLTISDSGCGMNQYQINEISAFSQFNKDEMQQVGLGLGLAIVKKILEIYNGSLVIDSIPNSYTKIKINLSID